MQGQAHQNKLLLFQVGPVKCSLFSNDILTIIPPPRQETAGHTGRLPGIFRHNNRIVRVVDMRSKFGLSPSSPERGRLILAEIPKGLVAFWVDQIINVIDQSEGRWDLLPAALPHDVFTRTFVLDEELILHSECPRLEAMRPSAGLTEHIEALQKQKQERARTAKPIEKPAISSKPTERVQATPSSAELEKPATDKTADNISRPQIVPAPRPTPRGPDVTAAPKKQDTQKPSLGTTTPRPQPRVGNQPEAAPTSAGTKPLSPPRRDQAQAPASAGKPVTTPPAPRPASPPPPRPSLQTPPPPPQRPSPATESPLVDEEDQDKGLMWLFLVVVLLLLGGSAALMYVNGLFDTTNETELSPPVTQSEEPSSNLLEPQNSEQLTNQSIQAPSETPATATEPSTPEVAPTPAVTETTSQPETVDSQQPETISSSSTPTGGAETTTPYSASIEKDEQGITITLSGPDKTSPDSSLKEAESTTAETAAAGTTNEEQTRTEETSSEPPAEKTVPATPIAPKKADTKDKAQHKTRKHEITHVVVKGDTLWAIAKRYVKDPYRYPELARLSGIKNPDRIYPGDIVRIIEK